MKTKQKTVTVTGNRAVSNKELNALCGAFNAWQGADDNAQAKFAALCQVVKAKGKKLWGKFKDVELHTYVTARLKAAGHKVTFADLTGTSEYNKEMRDANKKAYELSRTAASNIRMKFLRVERELGWVAEAETSTARLPKGAKAVLDPVEGSIAKMLAKFDGKEAKAVKAALIEFIRSL